MLETIRKVSLELVDSDYDPALCSLISYQFTPHPYPLSRLTNCTVFDDKIDGKELFIIDNYFHKEERDEVRDFSQKATFSRAIPSYPAQTMNHQERLLLFSLPPAPLLQVYKLLSGLGHAMDATISTLPWELAGGEGDVSSSVAANYLCRASRESMELGIHKDSSPETRVAYAIPNLYDPGEVHPKQFVNGDPGCPLIVSLMLYAHAENYRPEYLMGTLFYDKRGEPVACSPCDHMRLVLFEGDIDHTIQESNIPDDVDTWRVSYVYKLLINPHHAGQCLRSLLHKQLANNYG
jgi:hypothetical protein